MNEQEPQPTLQDTMRRMNQIFGSMMPKVPGVPSLNELPTVPGLPAIPGMPAIPGLPKMPPMPSLPTAESLREAADDLSQLAAQVPGASQEVAALWVDLLRVQSGSPAHEPHPKDARFADPTWRDNAIFRTWAQSYLAWVAMVDRLGKRLDDSGVRNAEAIKFATGILTTAMSPTNYFWSNPAAVKRAYETGGQSLLTGLSHWVDDLTHNKGMPSMVSRGAFTVGEDLAVTPGAVVTRDPVAELIQYAPTTDKVRARPTIVVPPPIGRFYFLDLAAGRSFVEYGVSQGLQMFMVSWRNGDPANAAWGIDEYGERVIRAIDEAKAITGADKVNLVGFCAGGILEATVLNRLSELGRDDVAAASFAVTLLDWRGKYPMHAFTGDGVMDLARNTSKRSGVFTAQQMGTAFTWLRPNDLVWNYWVNNYLMGKEPPAFDILAWNADGTALPATLHSEFLEIFKSSPLAKPGTATYLGSTFDAARITVPVFVQGAVTDHLTPWQGTYRTTQMVGSDDITYVLSNAGHIASLVNPPTNPKASYFSGDGAGELTAEQWQAQAQKESGSWWTAWTAWSAKHSGNLVAAPKTLGGKDFPELAPAPGLYVVDQVA